VVAWLLASSGDQTLKVTGSVLSSCVPSVCFAKGTHLEAVDITVANVAGPAQLLALPKLDTGVERPFPEPPPPALDMDDDHFNINVMLECIPPEDQEVFAQQYTVDDVMTMDCPHPCLPVAWPFHEVSRLVVLEDTWPTPLLPHIRNWWNIWSRLRKLVCQCRPTSHKVQLWIRAF
jgi:hypothetical protein